MPTSDSDKINFSRTSYEIRKHWYYYLIAFILFAGFAAFYVYKKNPVYLFTSQVMIEQPEGSSGGGMAAMMKTFSIGSFGGGSVDDEQLVLESRSMLCEVISALQLNRMYVEKSGVRNLSLYKKSPVAVLAPDALFDTLKSGASFRIKLNADGTADIKVKQGMFKTVFDEDNRKLPMTITLPTGGTFAIDKTPFYKPGEERDIVVAVSSNNAVAEEYAERMDIDYTSKKANGILCTFKDNDLRRGTDFLNTLMTLYNRRRKNEKALDSTNEMNFIDERLATLTGQLDDAEKKMEQFKTANNVTDIGMEAKVLLEQTSSNKQSIVGIQTQLAIFDMICRFLDDPKNRYSMIPVTSGVEYESAAKSIEAYNELVLQRMRLDMSAKKDNRSLVVLNSQIDGMRAGVVETLRKARESAEIAYNDMQREDGKFSSRLRNLPSHERRYMNLLRDQQIKNNLYIFLLEQRENSAMRMAGSPIGRILDTAYHDEKPINPNMLLVVGLVVLLTLLLPTIVVVVRSLRMKRIEVPYDVQRATGLPVFAEVSETEAGLVDFTENAGNAAAFRQLRNAVANGTHRLIYVCGSENAAEYIAKNLAYLCSLSGRRIALVDACLASHNSSLPFGGGIGVSGYLQDEKTLLKDIATTDSRFPGLEIYPSGKPAVFPQELLLSEKANRMFNELKEAYDIVVVWSPFTEDSLAENADTIIETLVQGILSKEASAFAANFKDFSGQKGVVLVKH